MKTKIVLGIIFISLILSVSFISANDVNIDASKYSIFDNFMYKLKQLGFFTAAGTARLCGDDNHNPHYTISGVTGYKSTTSLLSSAGCNYALFNVFDKDWHFLGEYRSEDVGGFQISSTATVQDYPAIIEVYCCPYKACNSNSDCVSMDEGTTCNINYGSCYGTAPTYTTKKYNCVSGNWVLSGTASFGEQRFCASSSTDNNYLDKSGGEHCRPSTYSSVTDGTWCSICTPNWQTGSWSTCSGGTQTRTVTDSNNCGVTTGKPATTQSCTVTTCKTQAQSCPENGVQSTCCSGLICQYFGCYPAPVCGDGICQSTETMTSCSQDCGTNIPICGDGDCEAGETIGATYECLADCGVGTNACSITECDLPRAECESKQGCVWDSGIFSIFPQCKPDGTACGVDSDGTGGNGEIGESKTITWTEYYSMSDDDFYNDFDEITCFNDNDCPIKDGYTTSCVDNGLFGKRIQKITHDKCDDNLGIFDELLTLAMLGIGSGDYCDYVPSLSNIQINYWTKLKEFFGISSVPSGYCIAEPDTWYGKLWDSALKTVGGLGIPEQYCVILTIVIFFSIIGFGVRMFT